MATKWQVAWWRFKLLTWDDEQVSLFDVEPCLFPDIYIRGPPPPLPPPPPGAPPPKTTPPSSGVHGGTPSPSGSTPLWSNQRSNKPPACPFIFQRLPLPPSAPTARLYFFICFFCFLFQASFLLSLFFLLLSSSLTSSLHCLFPAVTGMLKVAKMLRMQRACALTFYSNNCPVFHVSRLPNSLCFGAWKPSMEKCMESFAKIMG